ncbi:5-guanidino-2-oxopentanoate decarboxylase [Ancylobacter oerskovii]|uniref:5-guanidino-2-oxopentanoate decarboxylase n=1 Tax=Ancylobacter oerskovii TaxID=459519 RepID=A0ABW4Z0I8_9HYPH|nr:5-guanidino-2-oxopentanoate decarboxylase [Ancylobacter oerskovii]MBS7542793.1 5-guanidino-2-oxopentanoate decarboxylase [Ancylobacter oerskovii]
MSGTSISGTSISGTRTVGEALIDLLEANGVEVVFGIPGVHTVELYRGLAGSAIRHITPRHEQGAGFMADGYARVTGKPGVALVITGPGLTNTITAMAQARQDSVPMLVISGVNRRNSLGQGRGLLHELPDQSAMMRSFALASHTLVDPAELPAVIAQAFAIMGSSRPGPVHIEIPTDVMPLPAGEIVARPTLAARPGADGATLKRLAARCEGARRIVLMCGGGAVAAGPAVTTLAERLDAPVVLTTNARGLLAGHKLRVPASPSLAATRALIAEADLVIGLGTEMGQTDYDMYADGGFPALASFVRVDIDALQLAREPRADLAVLSTVEAAVEGLLPLVSPRVGDGAARAASAREAAWNGLSAKIRTEIGVIERIYQALPEAIIVGDSTQPVYAGNLYLDINRPLSWFNAATGYGALGYGPPAAIGAAIGAPGRPVVCLTGDGGLQFSLAEIGSAADAGATVIFLVWNNDGYQEIETYMVDCGIVPEGVKPSPPDFAAIAGAYGVPAACLDDVAELGPALAAAAQCNGPSLIEIHQTRTRGVSPS